MCRSIRWTLPLLLVILLTSCQSTPSVEILPTSLPSTPVDKTPEDLEPAPTIITTTTVPEITEAANAQSDNEVVAKATVEESVLEESTLPYRLIAVNYTLTDIGDGWEEGMVYIAVENISSEPLIPGQIELGEAFIETLEGQIYPSRGSDYFTIPGPVIPSLRFLAYQNPASPNHSEVSISWKSAVAATPSRIVFSSNPDVSIDLPEPNNGLGISFGIDESTTEVLDVAELEGLQLTSSSTATSLSLTGNCVYRGGLLYLQVEGTNNDQFNEVTLYSDEPWNNLGFGSLDPNTGFYRYTDIVIFTDNEFKQQGEIGPGQLFNGYLTVYDNGDIDGDPGNVIVLWQGDSSIVFSHNCTAELMAGEQPASDEPLNVDATSFPFLFVAGRQSSENAFILEDGHIYGATMGGAPQLLPNLASHTVKSNIAWSPDNSVVFYNGSEIIKVNISTGAVTHLSDLEVTTLDLSPDGRQLAFDNNTGLYILATDTGQTRILLEGAYGPVWSPDGQQLTVFKSGELILIDSNGEKIRTLLTEDSNVPAFAPSWSPDGTQIVFSCVLDSWVHLCGIDADGSNLRGVAGKTIRTIDGISDYGTFMPDWNPTGIVFIHKSPEGNAIYLLTPDNDQMTRITTVDDDLDIGWVVSVP